MAQYLKPDSELGYIEDQAEIENLKINNLRHTILGCMLGDFDETGAYVVDPEIVKELIEMPKYVVETYDNIEVCKSVLKLDKQITFMVTFEGNKATLSLVEKLSYEANFAINSGTYSNINEFVLDTVETSGEVNRNAIYTRWNIGNFGGDVIDIFNCDDAILEKYFGIVNRFKYLLHVNKVLLDKEEIIEEIEASYTNEIFEILKHYPKLQTAVMKQITETLQEKKDAISVAKPNFAKTFNELLENAIQSNLNELDDKQKEEFAAEKRNATVNMNVRRAEVLEIENIDIDNDAEDDLSPKVIRLKTDAGYTLKTITELGEEFVSANKDVTERKQEKGAGEETEKGKLIATLVGAGVGAMIGGTAGAVVGAATGSLVADVAEKLGEAKKDTAVNKPTAKKPETKKAETKKDAKKPDAKKKPTNKKKADTKKKDDNKKDKDEDKDKNKDDEKEKSQRRLFPIMTVGDKLDENKEKAEIVADMLTPEEMMKKEAEMAEQEKLKKETEAMAGNVKQKTIIGTEVKTTNTTVTGQGVVEEIKTLSATAILNTGSNQTKQEDKSHSLTDELTI